MGHPVALPGLLQVALVVLTEPGVVVAKLCPAPLEPLPRAEDAPGVRGVTIPLFT